MIHFLADPHFGHENILKFEPGRLKLADNANDHDVKLISRINSRVKAEDTLIIVGDFGLASASYLRSCAQAINGKKVLLRGNHDKHNDSQYLRMGFTVVANSMTMKIAGQFVLVSHWPYRKPWYKAYFPWQYKERDRHKRPIDRGQILLHGHIHSGGRVDGVWKVRGRMINVGVDVWDYYPVSIDKIAEIVQRMGK